MSSPRSVWKEAGYGSVSVCPAELPCMGVSFGCALPVVLAGHLSRKLVAIAVIDEKNTSAEHTRLKSIIQQVARDYRDQFHSELKVPTVVVLNTSNQQYFLLDRQINNAEDMVQFINNILDGTVDSVFRSSPLLGCFLFGLPLGVVSIMCYGIYTADADGHDERYEVELGLFARKSAAAPFLQKHSDEPWQAPVLSGKSGWRSVIFVKNAVGTSLTWTPSDLTRTGFPIGPQFDPGPGRFFRSDPGQLQLVSGPSSEKRNAQSLKAHDAEASKAAREPGAGGGAVAVFPEAAGRSRQTASSRAQQNVTTNRTGAIRPAAKAKPTKVRSSSMTSPRSAEMCRELGPAQTGRLVKPQWSSCFCKPTWTDQEPHTDVTG
ncbi:hypothetical protein CB1_001792010 [Camelus ferus]|nr:hypothetical protein CB1_001792010 [Camelus ferus]